MPNRLANETSPYLLQHAHNPVDWYPWGDEALDKAQAEDKPIFLSIGYSACHWCHVMERESFEDERVAEILNQHFVSVKVDREERPDLDRIYMNAVQVLAGRGGWPMSVFLTPEGEPFYGGTYFPPENRYGMPSFANVLLSVVDAWQKRRQELISGSQRVTEAIASQMEAFGRADGVDLEEATLKAAVEGLQQDFDWERGGWGGGPKFPQPMVLEFLLAHHHTADDPRALEMVTQTLEAMARGGIYDQLSGGFHRYSVDDRWLVPHFEKMLYDNAQLARVYLHAWQVTGEPLFHAVVEETLDYVLREMTHPDGGFYSTQDADSEGEEGKFFLWEPEQIRAVLGDQAERFIALYGVTPQGNFEGRNILTFSGTFQERKSLADARRRLFEAREERVHPDRDEKVLTSWNGMMLAAFAEAARVLGRDEYRRVAQRNAALLLDELRTDEGRLHHTWKDGESKINGYLEDHVHLIDGLIELYQTDFDPRWYEAAREVTGVMIEHFSAPNGGFYDTSDDHETLIARPRDLQDNAVPSGNAMAAFVLLRLAGLAVEPQYADVARGTMAPVQRAMGRYPLGFGQWLSALEYALAPPRELAIVGEPEARDTQALLDLYRAAYWPHVVLAAGGPGDGEAVVPLLRDRERIDGQATAYLCVDFTCRRPVTEVDQLEALLEGIEESSAMGSRPGITEEDVGQEA